MALVNVREKGAPEGAPITQVDEAWLERWPDDYDRVDEPEAAPAAPAAPAAQQPPRQRPADI